MCVCVCVCVCMCVYVCVCVYICIYGFIEIDISTGTVLIFYFVRNTASSNFRFGTVQKIILTSQLSLK